MSSSDSDVLILGGGIAGLSAGVAAKKRGLDFKILEASPRLGGALRTEKKEEFLLELGPNTVVPNLELMKMIDTLGLKDQMLIADPKTPRYIQFRGSLRRLPLSPFSFLTTSLISLSGKLRLLAEIFIAKGKDHHDESLSDFIERRLGQQAVDRLLKPFVSGVWAGNADELSAYSSFPKLKKWEEEYGGLIKGALKSKKIKKGGTTPTPEIPKGLLSFKEGLETLPKALGSHLGGAIRLEEEVQEIYRDADDQGQPHWKVRTRRGLHSAQFLILTIPAKKCAALFKNISPEAAFALEEIPYAPLCVLHLSHPRRDFAEPLNGFGYLTAPSEKSPILGCLWSSGLFPGRAPKKETLLTIFMGGATRPDLMDQHDKTLEEMAQKAVASTLRLKEKSRLLKCTRYKEAIPQYVIGHRHKEENLKKTEGLFEGVKFTGNYRGGISVGEVVKNSIDMMSTIQPRKKWVSVKPQPASSSN